MIQLTHDAICVVSTWSWFEPALVMVYWPPWQPLGPGPGQPAAEPSSAAPAGEQSPPGHRAMPQPAQVRDISHAAKESLL